MNMNIVEYSKTNAGKCEVAIAEIMRVAGQQLEADAFSEIYRNLMVISELRSEYKD